jgi:hypothetical protein
LLRVDPVVNDASRPEDIFVADADQPPCGENKQKLLCDAVAGCTWLIDPASAAGGNVVVGGRCGGVPRDPMRPPPEPLEGDASDIRAHELHWRYGDGHRHVGGNPGGSEPRRGAFSIGASSQGSGGGPRPTMADILTRQVPSVRGALFRRSETKEGLDRERAVAGPYGSAPAHRSGPWWQNRLDAQGLCAGHPPCPGLDLFACKSAPGCRWSPAAAAAAGIDPRTRERAVPTPAPGEAPEGGISAAPSGLDRAAAALADPAAVANGMSDASKAATVRDPEAAARMASEAATAEPLVGSFNHNPAWGSRKGLEGQVKNGT